MQILLVSDLHYKLKQLDWIVSVAGDFDLVVAAGDLLDIASIVETAGSAFAQPTEFIYMDGTPVSNAVAAPAPRRDAAVPDDVSLTPPVAAKSVT